MPLVLLPLLVATVNAAAKPASPTFSIADMTMQHPRCVFQVLKRHFARYTPELVESQCGIPQHIFLKTAEAFTSASGREKTAAICYAVGWTQHSKGPQIIRSAAILQLLLGNIGRPGGGILALRGHASIQGSTDIPTLYDILPGYLPMPFCTEEIYTASTGTDIPPPPLRTLCARATDLQVGRLHQEAHCSNRHLGQFRKLHR